VFAHYVNDTMKITELWMYPNLASAVFIIDPLILKEQPFIVCNSMQYGSCSFRLHDGPIMQKPGNLKRMPNMKPLDEYIHQQLKNNIQFTNTHEVIFKSIPLKYIKAIVIHDGSFKSGNKVLNAIDKKEINELQKILASDYPNIQIIKAKIHTSHRNGHHTLLQDVLAQIK